MAKRDYRKFLIAGVLIVAVYLIATNRSAPSELSTVGYTQVQTVAGISNNSGVVVLTGGCYQVVGNTDSWIADAIMKGQDGKVDTRPSIYDVTKDMMNGFGMKVLMVKVVDVRDNTFIGRLIVQQGNRIVSLDSRPSDATAIAVRTNAPVYMRDDILLQHGQKVC
ncbi:bifunctional nuclease family protein [archaeon]|nr:MAG: bifunctional nuclease family protein [archaeon]